MMHWKLNIDTDQGIKTENTFNELKDALNALKEHDNPDSFIVLWDCFKSLNQTIKQEDIKSKVEVGQYNTLYGLAEQGLQNSWIDLGLFDDINDLAGKNKEFKKLSSQSGVLPPSYYLYKKHANYIVDKILEELSIKVD